MAEQATTRHTEQRQTGQRRAIINALIAGDRALSAQELHEQLRASDSGVGLATVYRNLGRLADEGEIDAFRRPNGETTYRACGSGHHHHLTCRECGRVVELHDCALSEWSKGIAALHGFTQVEHHAELVGVCADCAAAA
jgi:Fur family ferric uptake transcriptional regulator